ncbi:MAG: NAD(P)/FAD-dependent oxidoreductase [Eubacteriales bacterium]|nr:NAD(P)/FAD-dependent oxidoreductase [Eubacteriales bacterium]MDD3881829.1 NAD(P)/FAD-dependent oxidoreductase [Eubacteriales bacterium]MDD4512925.1 NAD(P)/FAD-dependent oxidoreductase [Eubacteriales bacterium]
MYDALILGSGPAGLSCALTLRKRGKSVLVVSNAEEGSYLAKAKLVDNYPGVFPMSGAELLKIMYKQAEEMKVSFAKGMIMQTAMRKRGFQALCGQELYEGRAGIIAIGAGRPKTLEGELPLVGNGVSYCGTCDGMLYRGKRVISIADTEEGAAETNFLASVCAWVGCFAKNKELEGKLSPNIERLSGKPVAVLGDGEARGIKTDKGKFDADGVFIFRALAPVEKLLPKMEMDGAAIRVNRKMETSIKGLFACGDITGLPHQAAKAVGEGNIAALSAVEYLDELKAQEA